MSEDSANAMQDPSAGVGARLRAAREGLGLSRADIAARTKIAERHLIAIEESRFSSLASRTYAVGFSRTYARAVGLDEQDIAASLRAELGQADKGSERPAATAYEPVDPSRVPSSRTAWLAGLAAFVLMIVGWLVWTQAMAPDLSEPPLPAPPAPSASPTQTSGPVTLTALQDGVWVKVTDASGAQLFQKEMARGEAWTVPGNAATPVLQTARPDALQVSIGAEILPPLAPTRRIVRNVVLTAEALRVRPAGGPDAAVPPVDPVAFSPATAPRIRRESPPAETVSAMAPPAPAPAAGEPAAVQPAASSTESE